MSITVPRLMPVDRAEKRAEWLDEQRTIYIDAEGRAWNKDHNGLLERLGNSEFKALKLRRPSRARLRRGFWGAYGDAPLILGRESKPGDHGMELFEILERPVKRKPFG